LYIHQQLVCVGVRRMLHRITRFCFLASGLVLGLISLTTPANPGLIISPTEEAIYLDFSELPVGGISARGIQGWQVERGQVGEGCLQVLPGGFLDITFGVATVHYQFLLKVVHRSNRGNASLSVFVNSSRITSGFVPSQKGFSENVWDVVSYLTRGKNRVRLKVDGQAGPYEIRRVELFSAPRLQAIEAHQMTHDVEGNRPVDKTASFSDRDRRALCWVKMAQDAIGRRLEWWFYAPSGELYFRTSRLADRYNWAWIKIRGRRAAELRGKWRVDLFLNGRYQLSVPFIIGKGSRPQILGIEFPSVIVADGRKNQGRVHFYDPDGDIVRAKFEVVRAVYFSPSSLDPDVEGEVSGSFRFYIYARTRQTVTLKVTLYDSQGNASEPCLFTFQTR